MLSPISVDTQARQQPCQAARFAGRDAVEQVLGGFLAHPLQGQELLHRQAIQVRHRFNQPALHQLFGQLFAESVNVHALAFGERFDPALQLGGTGGGVGAIIADFLADCGCAADGTPLGKLVNLLASRPRFVNRPHHIGDDLTGLDDDHIVPHPDVLGLQLARIVQGGSADGCLG